jgi:hypothetical protein
VLAFEPIFVKIRNIETGLSSQASRASTCAICSLISLQEACPGKSCYSLSSYNGNPNNDPDVFFLLNFATAKRAALLSAATTLALLHTSANEHFGIVPVGVMSSGLPVLACQSSHATAVSRLRASPTTCYTHEQGGCGRTRPQAEQRRFSRPMSYDLRLRGGVGR